MPKRTVHVVALLLVVGFCLVAPAVAKTGELDHILITGPDGRQLEVLGAMLDGQLSEAERDNVYWPLLNGTMGGGDRPTGDLGPGYRFIYVLRDVRENPVKLRETVYLEADPPVAYAPKGQTAKLYSGDVREVPSGWRPFPEAAVPVIFSLMEEAARERPPGGTAEWVVISPWMMVTALLVLAGLIWLFVKVLRRMRSRRDVPT